MINMEKTSVDVIIVSHNNKDIIGDCLNSIINQSYKNIKIYLLDNDSTDGTSEYIMKKYPKINFKNFPGKGPSEKRSIGLSLSNSKYVVFMDSDARLTKDWIKIAVKYMESHLDVGLCNGKIFRGDGLIDSAGGILARNGSGTDIGYGEKDTGQYNSFRRVGYLKSASLIVRKKMTEEIGGFDSDYYYGVEDSDLGLRANISGWKVVYNPNLISHHLSHYTMKSAPMKKEIYRDKRNKLMTFLKNFEAKTILLNSPLLAVDFFQTLLFKKHGLEVFRAYLYNLDNFEEILRKRKEIQKNRKVSDSELFDLIEVPILLRTKDIEKKYLGFIRNVNKRKLSGITFFITTKCNSKCKHCFYWKSLNKNEDLSLEEIEKILSKFYNLSEVLLSGGEPFIRKDFPQIIDLIVKYTNPRLISIPTNCLMEEKVVKDMELTLKKYPNVDFAIDCSLDGLEARHDFLRGIKGNFKKSVHFIKTMNELRKKYSNFKFLTVNTVITKENMNELPPLVELVKTLDLSDHFFDLIRGEHKGLLTLPTQEELKKINTLRYNTRIYYNSKKHKSSLKRLYSNLRDRHIIISQMEVLNGEKWPFNCNAGKNDLILESDGSLRICELQPKIGNLKDKSNKIISTPEQLLHSENAKAIFNQIKNHKCDCTHICNVSSSMGHNFKDILITRPIVDTFKKNKYFE